MRRLLQTIAVCAAIVAPAGADIVDRIAATVNDIAIPESEVRKAMVVSALSPQAGENPDAFRIRILDALIDQHLEYEDAVRFGPAPPDAADVEKAWTRLRDRLEAEGKNPDAEFASAGMTPEEVRASLERQLVIAKYLRERFSPIAYADEQQAKEEYEKHYVPEQAAAGQPASPFEAVAEEMRQRSSERAFDEEVARWLGDLRQKSRVSIYRIPEPIPEGRAVTVLSTVPLAPAPARTPHP